MHRRLTLQELDQLIELTDGDLVVIAQATVRGVHQLAKWSGISQFHGAQHPIVFADYVPRSAGQRLWKLFYRRTVGYVPQSFDAEQLRRLLALRATFIVLAARQRAGDTGVDQKNSRARG